jgi:hypothetical protein
MNAESEGIQTEHFPNVSLENLRHPARSLGLNPASFHEVFTVVMLLTFLLSSSLPPFNHDVTLVPYRLCVPYLTTQHLITSRSWSGGFSSDPVLGWLRSEAALWKVWMTETLPTTFLRNTCTSVFVQYTRWVTEYVCTANYCQMACFLVLRCVMMSR